MSRVGGGDGLKREKWWIASKQPNTEVPWEVGSKAWCGNRLSSGLEAAVVSQWVLPANPWSFPRLRVTSNGTQTMLPGKLSTAILHTGPHSEVHFPLPCFPPKWNFPKARESAYLPSVCLLQGELCVLPSQVNRHQQCVWRTVVRAEVNVVAVDWRSWRCMVRSQGFSMWQCAKGCYI